MATIKSPVWGGTEQPITQLNGANEPGVPDEWYAYAVDWGLPYGSHPGLDVAMPVGTKLYAIAPGTVEFGGEDLQNYRPGHVDIHWQDGSRNELHIYGHMSSVAVRTGDVVRSGQYIGRSGEQTWRGTRVPDTSGPHLHFERRDLNARKSLDPRGLLQSGYVTPWGGDEKSNWPSAAKIDAWIATAERSNGRLSPVHGMGAEFVRLGEKYGVNPGVVVAIMQRESQMGADGSMLPSPAFYNFAGITDPDGVFYGDRKWKVFQSPADGLEGVFRLLAGDPYKSTDGSLGAIMELYSPRFENDWGAMWNTFGAVGKSLGIELTESTNIYEAGGATSDSGGDDGGWAEGILSFSRTAGERIGLGLLGILGLIAGVILLVGPENVPGVKNAVKVVEQVTS